MEGSSFLGEVSTPAHAIWSNYEQFHSKKLLLFVAELKNIKNCGRYSDIVAVRYPALTSVEAWVDEILSIKVLKLLVILDKSKIPPKNIFDDKEPTNIASTANKYYSSAGHLQIKFSVVTIKQQIKLVFRHSLCKWIYCISSSGAASQFYLQYISIYYIF